MTLSTNNPEWAPGGVAALYRCRWQINGSKRLKQIKQTPKLADSLGHNANALR